MSNATKAGLITLSLWVGAQAVAWLYGGKEVAGMVALGAGLVSFVVYPVILIILNES